MTDHELACEKSETGEKEVRKESFILHLDWKRAVFFMNNEEAGILLKAIYAYHAGEKLPENMPENVLTFLLLAQPFFEENAEKYRKTCLRNRANGARGGRPKNP